MKIACFIILSLIPVALMESAEKTSAESSETERTKRSGNAIGGVIQSLQKSAFGASAALSQGSANGVAGLSSSSSSSGGHSSSHDSNSYGHEYDEHHDTKSFDGWSLKKSILNTLLQAVKAIAGGVTTLQGQLIKGSGYLVQQKGKLIQSGGDAVSNAGKNIVASAHLVTVDSGHGSGYASGGHGGSSLGHSLGNSFGGIANGLTKAVSSLSSGSSKAVSGASASSSSGSSHSSSGHSSSGGHSAHSDGGYTQHGEYDAVDHGHGVTYTHSYDDYDKKPATFESYGPPKSTVAHIEPHAIHGTPEHNDESYKFSDDADMLSEILKNIPHKPMKTVGQVYSSDSPFNQIPNEIPPPPFKPLKEYGTPIYVDNSHTPHSEYGPPNTFYSSPSSDYSTLSSQKQSIYIDPKAYDAYHSMKIKLSKPRSTAPSLPGPVTVFDGIIDNKGLEIQKSIVYEITAR